MPPPAPLDMPVQSFASFSKERRRRFVAPALRRSAWTWIARLLVFGGALALTAYGAHEMYGVVAVSSNVTFLQWVLLVLFVVNFSWIALAFTSGVVGFLWLVTSKPPLPTLPQSLNGRTAVVMPIYNEAPSRVFAAMQAIYEDVDATGLGRHFDFFMLSDTTNPDIFIAEERALLSMRAKLGPNARFYYRHRRRNTARKAGNIADFVSRWGGAYAYMVVLDADSLMTGFSIAALAQAMEADPDAGIIQTLPLVINRNTVFARVQQFAARIYGPVIGAGLSAWMARDGNYWGHNAIIRTAAFAAHCGLPNLKGKPPFGGHILSHDFVEAALMRRAGYSVYMLPTLGGSYEESPPSLIDVAARDRRWCQGNLQHIRILTARGLHVATRQHIASGIMSYLASPFWMAQLLVGILIVFQAGYIRPEYFTGEFTLFPTWPRFDAQRALQLFATTMGILLAPKFFGLIVALFDSPTRRACGGALRLIASISVEIVISALLAPIMMLIQTGSVVQILSGRDTGWNPQRRDDGSIPLRDIMRRHRSHVAMGVITLVAGLLIPSSLIYWMSPTIAGLILAVALSWASGQRSIGLALRRIGLLVTPEEVNPPEIAARSNALQADLGGSSHDSDDALRVIHDDAGFRKAHEFMLPEAARRRRGDIEVDRVLAEAKLNDATSLDDAVHWLAPKERMIVLYDRALIDLLARLPNAPAKPTTGPALVPG
jgi:membrane glycosyltransferase